MPKTSTGAAHPGETGYSLLELLVTTTVLLAVLSGAMTAFGHAIQANEAATMLSDASQNLRAGMNLMVRDLLQAGQGIPTGGIPIPTGDGTVLINRPGPPGTAFTFDTADSVLPAVSPGAGIGPTVLGQTTDLITMLYADSTLALEQTPLTAIAADGTSMTVDNGTDITHPWNGLAVGDLILFSNALGNALQQVTRTSGGQTVFFDVSDSLNLNQPGAPEGGLFELQSGPGVFPPTTATRIMMITYFVDNVTTPDTPRLVRQVNNRPPRAMAGAIEDLHITYDLVDGVTNPAEVSEPVDPNTPNQIRKVNLHVGVRSEVVSAKTHDFKRLHSGTQVSLRSLSFMDRYR